MKDALKHFLDDSEKNTSHARQPVKVIFLGQRRTDPYSGKNNSSGSNENHIHLHLSP